MYLHIFKGLVILSYLCLGLTEYTSFRFSDGYFIASDITSMSSLLIWTVKPSGTPGGCHLWIGVGTMVNYKTQRVIMMTIEFLRTFI